MTERPGYDFRGRQISPATRADWRHDARPTNYDSARVAVLNRRITELLDALYEAEASLAQAWADGYNHARVEMLSEAVWTCPDCEGEFPASCSASQPGPTPDDVPSAENDVAQRLMAAMFCKVEQDWPEGPCCDGSIPCAHPPIWYCAEHDWWEDDHTEGVCGYALMLAGVALGTRVIPPGVA